MQRIAFAIAVIFSVSIASPVLADGEIVITQAKALAGNVTPGDTAGFPVTLSQPGAYILGSNLTVPGYTYGIIATTNNVDIDMRGFRLVGNNFGTYGVVSNYAESRIHGGVITTFRNAGIYIRNNDWTIEDMKIVRNAGGGIDASDQKRIVVQDSTLLSNGSSGIRTGNNGKVQNSIISQHTNLGIYINGHGIVDGNNIAENNRALFIVGGLVTGNFFSNNTSYAIEDGNILTSVTNNSFLSNNPTGTEQIYGAIDVYGNTCVGKPC